MVFRLYGDDWRCPWCDEVAALPPDASLVCESRQCACGALGLGAPPWDTDEVIDDAINVFGIAEGFMTPFDADRLAGLQKVGVEVREGRSIPASGDRRFELRVLWFRRRLHAT